MTKSVVTCLNSKGFIIDGLGNYRAHWEGCYMQVGAHGRYHPLHSTATSPTLGSQKLISLTAEKTAWRCNADHSDLRMKGKFTALSWLSPAAYRGKQAESEGGVACCQRGDVESLSVVHHIRLFSGTISCALCCNDCLKCFKKTDFGASPLTLPSTASCSTPPGLWFLFSGHPPTVDPLLSLVISRKIPLHLQASTVLCMQWFPVVYCRDPRMSVCFMSQKGTGLGIITWVSSS